ncbi:hypothetical protein, partial [Gluconacetobacter azotocaptans]|uniref:hypothetical protein n=1 Tax=Gluconacetobacter azotocaptans TaxID=142834 RepID=UPI00222FE3E1
VLQNAVNNTCQSSENQTSAADRPPAHRAHQTIARNGKGLVLRALGGDSMSNDPKHVIIPIFYNHRGAIIFRDRPVKIKPKPSAIQSILGLVNQKSIPKEETIYQDYFYCGFEFNPKKQKLINVLMGDIFDYLHSRGMTFNYPGVDQDSIAEDWVGSRRYHVVAVMADVRNSYLCAYGYLDAATKAFIEDDNQKRHRSKTRAPSLSVATVKDMIRKGELDEANIRVTSVVSSS